MIVHLKSKVIHRAALLLVLMVPACSENTGSESEWVLEASDGPSPSTSNGPRRATPKPSGPREPLTNIAGVVAGAQTTCFWLYSGEVECIDWEGSLTKVQGLTGPAVQVSIPGGTSEYVGRHACAVLDSGDVQCWGKNNRSQLGDGSSTDSEYALPVGGISEAVEVQTAGNTSCVRTTAGSVRCWGDRLGSSPMTLLSAGAVGLAVGYIFYSSRSDTEDSYAYVFALNSAGEAQCLESPSTYAGRAKFPSPASQIAIMGDGLCAVLESREVYCVDDVGTCWVESEPRKVVGLPDAVQVAANDQSWTISREANWCILGTDSKVYCWGGNQHGQLGLGYAASDIVASPDVQPVEGIDNAVSVSVGEGHVCALLDDGTAKCWGQNDSGQLSDGSFNDRTSPVVVTH